MRVQYRPWPWHFCGDVAEQGWKWVWKSFNEAVGMPLYNCWLIWTQLCLYQAGRSITALLNQLQAQVDVEYQQMWLSTGAQQTHAPTTWNIIISWQPVALHLLVLLVFQGYKANSWAVVYSTSHAFVQEIGNKERKNLLPQESSIWIATTKRCLTS